MFGLSYLKIGAIVAVALFAAWVWRVDNLRAKWHGKYDAVVTQVVDATCTPQVLKADPKCEAKIKRDPAQGISFMASKRDQYRRERDDANETVRLQTEALDRLEAQAAEAQRQANVQLVAARRAAAERDRWIKTAKEATTRVNRLPDVQELKEVEEALDALYAAGY